MKSFEISANKLWMTVSEQINNCLFISFDSSFYGKHLLWTIYFHTVLCWVFFFLFVSSFSWHGTLKVAAFNVFCYLIELSFLIFLPLPQSPTTISHPVFHPPN
jgi:hypothetical protein